jgi:hypothetical protein
MPTFPVSQLRSTIRPDYPTADSSQNVASNLPARFRTQAHSQFPDLPAKQSPGASAVKRYRFEARPPIGEIGKEQFHAELRKLLEEISEIANNPKVYSPEMAGKASRGIEVGRECLDSIELENPTRYFSYKLGDKHVAFMQISTIARPASSREARRTIIEFRVSHPLVANAGDILLEHAMRLNVHQKPVLQSYPASAEAESRNRALGFSDPDEDGIMRLSPTATPRHWTLNEQGEWQRAGKPNKYLVDDV